MIAREWDKKGERFMQAWTGISGECFGDEFRVGWNRTLEPLDAQEGDEAALRGNGQAVDHAF